jgi:hypothetical protein
VADGGPLVTSVLLLGVAVMRVLAVALLGLASIGCAADRHPSSSGTPAPARTWSATAADVEVVVIADAWRGWPRDLWRVVTPIHVSITNRGDVPLRVARANFALLVDGRRRLAAADPHDVRGVIYEPPPAVWVQTRAGLPPPGYTEWALQPSAPTGSWDPRVGDQFALPTPEMLERALPEGVLEPGRTTSGFLYFERAPAAPARLELTALVVDALSGEPRGTVVVQIESR